MVYFRLAVKRPNIIKIHDNTMTKDMYIIIIIITIIITDLYSAFRSEDTEALDAAQED